MRTEHSMKNITISIISQIVIVILGFLSRKVFVDSLDIGYLGINGLLTNILSMMALVEGGIGLSIVYNLYKPLAENDRGKVIALVQLYRKVYFILSLIILGISFAIYPFLGSLMKGEESISNIALIYFLFIAKTMVSYLNAHKWSLINADQRGYVLARMNLLFQVVTTLAKIAILVLTQNFILYLIVELILYVIQNLVNGRIVNNRYSYIKTRVKHSIDLATKENMIKNIKALFLHNIGGFLVFGTDNLLISSFISLAAVGLYSNYIMITSQLSTLVNSILNGIGASVGNLIATESTDKNYSVFKVIYLVNFWLYSVCIICLYNLLEPFINWWLGDGYLLGQITFVFILINLYLNGMRTAISTFKTKAGLFVQDKYAPLIEGLINLISSLILVRYFGLAGIFMGTTISTVSTILWTQPVIVYRNLFKLPVHSYFSTYTLYAGLTLLVGFLTTFISTNVIMEGSFFTLVIRGVICLLIPNAIYIALFHRTREFQYLISFIRSRIIKQKTLKSDTKGA